MGNILVLFQVHTQVNNKQTSRITDTVQSLDQGCQSKSLDQPNLYPQNNLIRAMPYPNHHHLPMQVCITLKIWILLNLTETHRGISPPSTQRRKPIRVQIFKVQVVGAVTK